MFRWLIKLFKVKESCCQDPHNVYIHIDGRLDINGLGSGNTPVVIQGPFSTPTAPKGDAGDIGQNKTAEASIGPEFFTSTDTPEVNFGTEIELPPRQAKNENS